MLIECAFDIFPEEIWEIIVDKCDNAIDVLKAIPQLRIVFRRIEFSLLIADIIPLIFPKLVSFSHMMECRLVSKRWKQGIDKCLESHPDLSPYNSTSPDDRVSETHFNYCRIPNVNTNLLYFFDHEDGNLKTSNTIWAANNPFPGRSVIIDVEYWRPRMRNKSKLLPPKKTRDSAGNSFPLLEKVGHHIWYVSFKLPAICYWLRDVRRFIEHLTVFLAHLPNLKSLKFVGEEFDKRDVPEEVAKDIIEILRKLSIPARVETIDLWFLSRSHLSDNLYSKLYDSFLALFVNHEQVKKLTINTTDWTNKIPSMLPNLVELFLQDCRHSQSTAEFSLKDILGQLKRFPRLQKLGVASKKLNAVKILKLISVEHITSLELVQEKIEEPTNGAGKLFNLLRSDMFKKLQDNVVGVLTSGGVSSIRILKITVMQKINLTFLNLLPSVQILYLNASSLKEFPQADAGDIISMCLDIASMQKKFNFKWLQQLWETYPKLNTVTAEISDSLYQFVREYPKKIFKSVRTDLV